MVAAVQTQQPMQLTAEELVEGLATMLGFSPEQLEQLTNSLNGGGGESQGDSTGGQGAQQEGTTVGEAGAESGEGVNHAEKQPTLQILVDYMNKVTSEAPQQSSTEAATANLEAMAKEGGSNQAAANALLGADGVLTAFNNMINVSLGKMEAKENNMQQVGDAIRSATTPGLESPNQSRLDQKMTSADVYGMIAKVLSKLAEVAYREKVVESSINNNAMQMKIENANLSNALMQEQMAIAESQRAKSKRLESHGQVVKAVTVMVSIVMWIVMIVIIIITAVIAVVLSIATLGIGSPAGVAMVIGVVTLVSTIMAAVQTATTALTIYMVLSDATQEGGMIDDMLEAFGMEKTEFNRILMQMILQFIMGVANILAALPMMVLTVVVVGMTVAMSIVMAIMAAMQILMLLVQVFVGSGFLEWAVRELAMAAGMSEEDARRLSFWTNIVVMITVLLITIAAAIASMGVMSSTTAAMTAQLTQGIGSTVGSTATVMAQNASNAGKMMQKIMDMVAYVAKNLESVMKTMNLVEIIMELFQGLAGIVTGALSIGKGVLQMEIAKLEKEKAQIQFKQELVEIMNQSLKSIIDNGIMIIESITRDTARTMEIGNKMWASLGRAGTAINERTLA
jgi:hypothetical protein